MDDNLMQLYNITEEIFNILQKDLSEDEDRTEKINYVNTLLEKRQEYIQKLNPPYSDKQLQLGKQIMKMELEIKKDMHQIYKELRTKIIKMKEQKDSNRTYINPYKNMGTVDGMYVDDKL